MILYNNISYVANNVYLKKLIFTGKTMIKNMLVYDGTGTQPFFSDVFINPKGRIPRACLRVSTEDDKITQIQGDINLDSCETIEGKELALSPRFINIPSYSDLEIFKNRSILHVIRQGLKTELVGQDDSSVTPLTDEIVTELADNTVPLAGVLDREYWWRSFGEYLNAVKKINPPVRIKSLIGHGTIRM